MSTMDWIISFAMIIAAIEITDALRFQEFADEMRRRRPRPHTFG
jgi:hypothetical protein